VIVLCRQRNDVNDLKSKDRSFDLDLRLGEIAENAFTDILKNQRVEVKREQSKWAKSGNIAIEYQWNGMPSGIATTPAEFWVQAIYNSSNELLACFVFPTEKLKALAKKFYNAGHVVASGDDKKGKSILIPINQLHEAMIDL